MVLTLITAGVFLWKYFAIVHPEKLLRSIDSKNIDSLYHISYGTFRIDENAGNAYLEDVHIVPDTSMIHFIPSEDWPPAVLEISVQSISIKGIDAREAINGTRIIGDTVIIKHPEILVYTLRPIQKHTKIESEARLMFNEMLGRLKRIHVGYILIDSINVRSVGFRSKETDFHFLNGTIQATDVLVDSTHHLDSSRVLFSKNAAFRVDSFLSFNHNRPEFIVSDVAFDGNQRFITFGNIRLNRFNDENSKGQMLIDAQSLRVGGLNTNEIIKDKNLVIDSVQCKAINFYEPPKESLAGIGKSVGTISPDNDSLSGFRNVYGLKLQYFGFENVAFIPLEKEQFDIGKISLRLHDIEASRLKDFESNPLRYIHEAKLDIGYVKFSSGDRQYNFLFNDIHVNSLEKKMSVGEVASKPVAGEESFAAKYPYQQDRFDISLQNLTLSGIEMENLFDHKIIASSLNVQNTIAKIYRDLNKPLEPVSKVGGYPSQLLQKLNFPFSIGRADLPSVFLEYREKQAANKRTGTIGFYKTSLHLTNITNVASEIAIDNRMTINFQTSVLNRIPLEGKFSFLLGSSDGSFDFEGKTKAFNAASFNAISVPMAMVKIKTGHISEISFDITGDNFKASGPFTMKYEDMKIEVLKKDALADTIKKRGLASLLANIVVKNSNPLNGELRKVTAVQERNTHKSFFNLVWKTVFNGIKNTVGIP